MSDLETKLKTPRKKYNTAKRLAPRNNRHEAMVNMVDELMDLDYDNENEAVENYYSDIDDELPTKKTEKKTDTPVKLPVTLAIETTPIVSTRIDNIKLTENIKSVDKSTDEDTEKESDSATSVEVLSKTKDSIEPEKEQIYFSHYGSGIREWDDEDEDKKDITTKIISGKTFQYPMKTIILKPGQFMYKWSGAYFTAADSVAEMCKLINKTSVKRFHEVCYERVKLFADIEKYTKDNLTTGIKVLELLTRVFRKLGVHELQAKNLHFQVDSSGKKSMHMIYNSGYVFKVNKYNDKDPSKNIHDSQYEFWLYVIDYLKDNRSQYEDLFYTDKDGVEQTCFDISVYNSAYHPMRTAYSKKDKVKDGEDEERYFRPVQKMMPKMTYYKSKNITPKQVINDPTCDKLYNFGIFPKAEPKKDIVYRTADEKTIREAVEEHCPGMSINEISGGLVKMARTNPGVCPFSGREHTSQNGYAVSYSNGLYYFCRSANCQEPEETNDKIYRKNSKGNYGVLIKLMTQRYVNAVSVLNRPIQEDNWKAKKQDIHAPFQIKELIYNHYDKLIARITYDLVNKNSGELMTDDDKEEDDIIKVFSKESRDMWMQWLDETIVRISNPTKNYYLVKDTQHRAITNTDEIIFKTRVEEKIMHSTCMFFGDNDARFSYKSPPPGRSRMTVGSFVRFAYCSGMIKIYYSEHWIPYDMRRPHIPQNGWNSFKGFAAELAGQKRLREHKKITVRKSTNNSRYKRLKENLEKQTNNLKDADEDIQSDKEHKKLLSTLKGFINNANKLPLDDEYRSDKIKTKQLQYDNEISDHKEAIEDRVKIQLEIKSIKVEMEKYEDDEECIEDDESKNKKFLNSIMYAHIRDVICDGNTKLFNWTLRYMAHMFQYPKDKPPVCLVWYGDEGAGKDCVCTWLSYLIGKDAYAMTGDIAHFTNKFNAAYADKLLTCFNEVSEAKVINVADILKHLFGCKEDGRIEKKGVDPRINIATFERYIINTNHKHQVNLPPRGRHHVMYKLNNSKCKPTNENRKYFIDLWAESQNIDAQIDAFQFFKYMDLSNFHITELPITDYQLQEVEHCLDPVNRFLLTMYRINAFDGDIEKLMRSHIRNLKPYQTADYIPEDLEEQENDPSELPDLPEEKEFILDDWWFDYEYTVNHIWDLYKRFCEDQGVRGNHMKSKRTFLAQLDSYKIGEKFDKKTQRLKDEYLVPKTIRPKCAMYEGKTKIKGYRISNKTLKLIVEEHLGLKANKDLIEDDEYDQVATINNYVADKDNIIILPKAKEEKIMIIEPKKIDA